MFARLASPFLYALLASTFFVSTSYAAYAVSMTNCPAPCPSRTPTHEPSGTIQTTSEAQQVGGRGITTATTTTTTSMATAVPGN
ncbi:hypothetical protein DEU56DRAFT_797885 [Suillus clintonianus]|uniref:uncharacterized protein n=1 Tax=Suillus clintonianus TaxID=1904413 RepID=UPI001B864891|nr:uncharacterized protein DEU56DRAFT_797885 [Suillus clintonianus]KAG2140636.1 hypothetical protein DEU56DRAFT_797885 [Suillus clintonianus]